ncbi:modulator of macroautophagy TMEM150B isoform X1 [Chlorocebus sabaeus]
MSEAGTPESKEGGPRGLTLGLREEGLRDWTPGSWEEGGGHDPKSLSTKLGRGQKLKVAVGREKEKGQVAEAVFGWLEGFSDGDVVAESSLPTHAQPAWGTPAGKRGRVRGRRRRAEGRRRGHQGSVSHRPETEAAPREQADLRPSLLGTRVELGMWGYLSLMPIFLAVWAISGVWIVFAIAVTNRTVDLSKGFPYISICGSFPPQSCIFSQVLNMGAALAAWICVVRYHQLRDWGVGRWPNQLILWTGLLCALGTSVVGNFQEKNQRPTHLAGAFLAFILGNVYFWLQLLLWRLKNLPQPGAPWIGPLRLGLCSFCTILIVAMIVLHACSLRSVSAACEWAVAMLLFALFGLFAVDFSVLESCTLCVQPWPSLSPPPASPISLPVQL